VSPDPDSSSSEPAATPTEPLAGSPRPAEPVVDPAVPPGDGQRPVDAKPATSAEVALSVREVSVRFGGVQALQGVSLNARAGSVTGLIGPNGAGKTTLFNVLSGLQRPDQGRVVLEGREITSLGPNRRAHLGLARTFQRLELFWSLCVEDNVRVGSESSVQWWRPRHVRQAMRRNRRAKPGDPGSPALGGRATRALLARVGLEDLAEHPVDALPTGQARLVELARALAIGPRVLLLDEPGSGLDDHESSTLGTLLRELAGEGMAILLVEHDMNLLMRVCDEVYVLDFGEVIASGTPAEVRSDGAVQAAYLGAAHPTTVGSGQGGGA
jgi:branched-chain amino acid transport system ATP-binding protein